MDLVNLMGSSGRGAVIARIGYGDFVYSFFPLFHTILRDGEIGGKDSPDFCWIYVMAVWLKTKTLMNWKMN